jgi:hypothetical protein
MKDGVVVRRIGPKCKKWAMEGKTRCELHGGLATGQRTVEGMKRALAARNEGYARFVERMNAEGKPFKCGRKPGAGWISDATRQRAAEEAERLGVKINVDDLPDTIVQQLSGLARERERLERLARWPQKEALYQQALRLGATGPQLREKRRQARNAPKIEVVTFADSARMLREQFDD